MPEELERRDVLECRLVRKGEIDVVAEERADRDAEGDTDKGEEEHVYWRVDVLLVKAQSRRPTRRRKEVLTRPSGCPNAYTSPSMFTPARYNA